MSEHIVYPRVYITIFLVLLVGTILTVVAAFRDFPGPLNAVLALTIAVVKATFVVLYFMHEARRDLAFHQRRAIDPAGLRFSVEQPVLLFERERATSPDEPT